MNDAYSILLYSCTHFAREIQWEESPSTTILSVRWKHYGYKNISHITISVNQWLTRMIRSRFQYSITKVLSGLDLKGNLTPFDHAYTHIHTLRKGSINVNQSRFFHSPSLSSILSVKDWYFIPCCGTDSNNGSVSDNLRVAAGLDMISLFAIWLHVSDKIVLNHFS